VEKTSQLKWMQELLQGGIPVQADVAVLLFYKGTLGALR